MQRGFAKWLGQIVIEPGLKAALAVAGEGVGCQRDHRYRGGGGECAGAAFGGADQADRFVAIHLGHLAVHQDQVKRLVRQTRNRLTSVFGHGYAAGGGFQHGGGNFTVDRIIFDQQDGPAQ